MPEYGLFENANHPNQPVSDMPTFDLHTFNEREREKARRERDSQEAVIEMERRTAEYLRQNENKLLELRRIADAAEQRAKSAEKQAELAEKEAESAKQEAAHSRKQSRISNLLSAVAIVIALLSWLIPRTEVVNFLSSLLGVP